MRIYDHQCTMLRMDEIVLLSVTNGEISVMLMDYHTLIPIYQKTSIYHIHSKPISSGNKITNPYFHWKIKPISHYETMKYNLSTNDNPLIPYY